MDWISIGSILYDLGKYISSEFNNKSSTNSEQLRLQQLQRAEEEKKRGLAYYHQNNWQDAITRLESAKRLNPKIEGIDFILAQARYRLARRKRILFFIQLLLGIAVIFGVYYLFILQ